MAVIARGVSMPGDVVGFGLAEVEALLDVANWR
jgi:hypothetical protein